MPAMTKKALSDCSYPESTAYNIRDDIDATITRLKVIIDEEASLRKALRALFVKRRGDAIEQVQLANLHLDLVNEEETALCADLTRAAASANEGIEGSGRVSNVRTGGIAMPTFSPIPTASLGNGPSLNKVEHNGRKTPVSPKTLNRGHRNDDTAPLRTPAGPTRSLDSMEPPGGPEKVAHGLFNEPPRSPARFIRAFDPPQSHASSTHGFANDPTQTSARSRRGYDEEPTRSPARSTRGLLDEPPRSPAHSTHAFEPPRSPARSARGLTDGPMPISPARFNRGLPNDSPPDSPSRSTRGLEDTYLSLDGAVHAQRTPGKTQNSLSAFSFGKNYGSGIEEPKKSPARHSTTLPTAFAFSGGGFGTSPTTSTGFGFGASPTVNTAVGFGASPTTNTGFPFGAGSQPPSTSTGFGAASSGNTGFGFGGTSPTINFGLRPRHPAFNSSVSPFGATIHPMQTPVAVEDTPASMDDLFADIMKDAGIEGGDNWGFGDDRDGDDDFTAGFDESRGKSPKVVTNDSLGERNGVGRAVKQT